LTVYVDSSFLVSSYIGDLHSPEADRRIANRPAIWITPLNRSEFGNVVYQCVFHGRFSLAEANKVWNNFDQDCAEGLLVRASLPDSIWQTSIQLARRYGPTLGVRTLDSLHVACAMELRAERFWTFDERQARLAEAVGLELHA